MQLFLCLQRWQRSSVGVKPFRPLDHLPQSAHELHLLLFKHVCRNHTSVRARVCLWERVCVFKKRESEREDEIYWENEGACLWMGKVSVCTLRESVCVCVLGGARFDQGSEFPHIHKESISNCFVIASVLNKSQLEAKMSNWFFFKAHKG